MVNLFLVLFRNKILFLKKAFSVESFDHEITFLNKGLIAIIIIYLFYMRDQLCKTFFHVQTVCIHYLKQFSFFIYLKDHFNT